MNAHTLQRQYGLKPDISPSPPAGPHDGADTADHLASIYESRDDQFAAAIPFIRQGLEQGEHCLYVADDTTR